jgi:ELP3 family radical SAM enzyme/protein acetyltransferase
MNQFDPVLQFADRAATLAQNGHPVDKIELLVLGGTWESYPTPYRTEFIRDLFFAANTFLDRAPRQRLGLAEEQRRNETASVKIIGLTLETRPDTIDAAALRRLREYGCTRVQLGLQHTDDAILKKINRGCTNADASRAIRLLKDACFKVDIHLMPNLPGASPAADAAMFDAVLEDPALQVDQWKIYPCEIVPWTVIERWHKDGKHAPYDDAALEEVLVAAKARVKPWVRLNRVRRDIPLQCPRPPGAVKRP